MNGKLIEVIFPIPEEKEVEETVDNSNESQPDKNVGED